MRRPMTGYCVNLVAVEINSQGCGCPLAIAFSLGIPTRGYTLRFRIRVII